MINPLVSEDITLLTINYRSILNKTSVLHSFNLRDDLAIVLATNMTPLLTVNYVLIDTT